MRKYAKYVLVTLLMFCVATSVNAEGCDYKKKVELNKQASTVKAVYEEVKIDSGVKYYDESEGISEADAEEVYYQGFKVQILNITKDIYVHVESGLDDSEKDYYYTDSKDGIIDLGEHSADYAYSIKITVFPLVENCGELLRTITLNVPRYNTLSEYDACKEYPNFEYCKTYVNSNEEVSLSKFSNRLETYKKSNKSITEIKKEEEQKNKNKLKEFFKKYKKEIVIGIIVIAIVGVATTTILIIRRRSRLI